MKVIDLKGNLIPEASYPHLTIKWHNSKYGLYCYSANLFFRSEDTDVLSKVEVVCKIRYVGKNKTPKFYEKRTATYLPVSRDGDIVSVPINCSELIKAISLNDWTLTRVTKKRKNLIGRAIKIGWSYAGKDYSYEFLPEDHRSPAMLCEAHTAGLSENEKADIRIALTPTHFSDNLFDL